MRLVLKIGYALQQTESEISLGDNVTKAAATDGGLLCQKILHPDMTEEFTSVIRNAWTEARLVAD